MHPARGGGSLRAALAAPGGDLWAALNLVSLPPHNGPWPAPTRVCTPMPRRGSALGERGLGLRGRHQARSSQAGVSRREPLRSHERPGLTDPHPPPKGCPSLKFKMPTISLISFPAEQCCPRPSQLQALSPALRACPAPPPAPPPARAQRSAAPKPSVGPGRHLRALRGSGRRRRRLPLAFQSRLLLPPPPTLAPRGLRQACHLPQLRDAPRAVLLMKHGLLVMRTFKHYIKTFEMKALSCFSFLGTIKRYEM